MKRLSTEKIHFILAGQNIQNIFSVIKELLDNSIDAFSSKIELYLTDYGNKAISLIDNGSGIFEEVLDNINRRGTSTKIDSSEIESYKDLSVVETHGFRGHALNAICNIAEVVILSLVFERYSKENRESVNNNISSNENSSNLEHSKRFLLIYSFDELANVRSKNKVEIDNNNDFKLFKTSSIYFNYKTFIDKLLKEEKNVSMNFQSTLNRKRTGTCVILKKIFEKVEYKVRKNDLINEKKKYFKDIVSKLETYSLINHSIIFELYHNEDDKTGYKNIMSSPLCRIMKKIVNNVNTEYESDENNDIWFDNIKIRLRHLFSDKITKNLINISFSVDKSSISIKENRDISDIGSIDNNSSNKCSFKIKALLTKSISSGSIIAPGNFSSNYNNNSRFSLSNKSYTDNSKKICLYFINEKHVNTISTIDKVISEIYKKYNSNSEPIRIVSLYIPKGEYDFNTDEMKMNVKLKYEKEIVKEIAEYLNNYYCVNNNINSVEDSCVGSKESKLCEKSDKCEKESSLKSNINNDEEYEDNNNFIVKKRDDLEFDKNDSENDEDKSIKDNCNRYEGTILKANSFSDLIGINHDSIKRKSSNHNKIREYDKSEIVQSIENKKLEEENENGDKEMRSLYNKSLLHNDISKFEKRNKKLAIKQNIAIMREVFNKERENYISNSDRVKDIYDDDSEYNANSNEDSKHREKILKNIEEKNVDSQNKTNTNNNIRNSVISHDEKDYSMYSSVTESLNKRLSSFRAKKENKNKYFNYFLNNTKYKTGRYGDDSKNNIKANRNIRSQDDDNVESKQILFQKIENNFTKNDFKELNIIGQFNKGFIVANKSDGIYIIDQHAANEKYNYENLVSNVIPQKQMIIIPLKLDFISSSDKLVLLDNIDIFNKIGFSFIDSNNKIITKESLSKNNNINTDDDSSSHNCPNILNRDPYNSEILKNESDDLFNIRITSFPSIYNLKYTIDDFHDVFDKIKRNSNEIHSYYDKNNNKKIIDKDNSALSSNNYTNKEKFDLNSLLVSNNMLYKIANKACRKSIMIGDSLSIVEIEKIVNELPHLIMPFNCPHGRPTIRKIKSIVREN